MLVPIQTHLSIKFLYNLTSTSANLFLNVYDLKGSLLKAFDFGFCKKVASKVINLENLASGAYKIVITNNNVLLNKLQKNFNDGNNQKITITSTKKVNKPAVKTAKKSTTATKEVVKLFHQKNKMTKQHQK